MTRTVRADDDEEQPLVIKVYRVIDLVVPVPNYPYEGTFLPGLGKSAPGTAGATITSGAGMGGGGGMQGGMGGTGGGMGGGMFRVPDGHLGQIGGGPARSGTVLRPSISPRITWGALQNTITSLIDPETWEDNGGPGSIQFIGGALGIRQTAAVHAKLEQFLRDLRREIGTLRQVSIDAQWVLLDSAAAAALRGSNEQKAAGTNEISRERLSGLAAETRRARGTIICINGQTVHLISGRLETKLQGAIPVVGGSEVGYQATLTTPHVGALLQITPLILPGEDRALVDLHSSVTEWDNGLDAVKLSGTNDTKDPAAQVDRISVEGQQLATSLSLPLGKPVLVGGMTFDDSDNDQQLYLILEVTADSDDKANAAQQR
ncbi:MAG TPA: hypothetical protein VGN12_30210 [Pirellulales bacterium]